MVNVATVFLMMLKRLAEMRLKLLQKSNSKIAEATGDLIGKK